MQPSTVLSELDRRGLGLARSAHTLERDRAVARFSRLGEHAAVWIALGAAGATLSAARGDAARAARWRRATATVAGAYALNTLVKLVVRRRRPQLPDLPQLVGTPTQLSFPSAHATSSFAAARAYADLGLPAPPLYALAGALAASRVYLGVHYPSDVLGGALLGALVARATR